MADILNTVKNVLLSSTAEQAMKEQMISIAADNLNVEGVTDVLLQALQNESNDSVRYSILECLSPQIKITKIRNEVLSYFNNMQNFGQYEFEKVIDLLQPYISREDKLRKLIYEKYAKLSVVDQKSYLLESLISDIRIGTILNDLINIFQTETDNSIRSIIFNKLKTLSVIKHLELLDIFSQEIKDPGSPYRLESLNAISCVIETSNIAKEVIEDVLRFDNDRELIRIALKTYLASGNDQNVEVLISVVDNELLDIKTRNRAVAQLETMELNPEQNKQLQNSLSDLNLK